MTASLSEGLVGESPLRAPPHPILLCAATRWEAGPLIRRWGLRRIPPRRPARFEGGFRGRRIVLLQTGVGPEKARQTLSLLSSEPYSCALSVGLAGALSREIAPADIVADFQYLGAEARGAAREGAASSPVPVHFGRIVSSGRVVFSARRKALLGESSRASAVDMETGALLDWGTERGTPVAAVRAAFDTLQDGLLLWLNIPGMALRRKKAMGALASFLEKIIPSL